MNFSKEEILLCKKIAEKCRKYSDEWGKWVYWERGDDKVVLIQRWIRVKGKHLIWTDPSGERKNIRTTKWFPLWQISDCLDFLRGKLDNKKEYHLCVGWDCFDEKWYTQIRKDLEDMDSLLDFLGNTPLESLLKAVLAIVEEEL